MRTLFLLAIPFCAAFVLLAEQPNWRAERDLHKRAEKGIEAAELQLDAARNTYREGDPYKAQEEVEAALDTAMDVYSMILESGENLRKRAGRFKKTEIGLRGLLRKLDDHAQQVEIVDKGPVERARKTVSKMQDNLLKAMFSGGDLPPVERVKP